MSTDILRYPSAQTDDFNEILVDQLKRTPWLLISGAVHAFLFILLIIFMKAPAPEKVPHTVVVAPDDETPLDEVIEEPEQPDPVDPLEEETQTELPPVEFADVADQDPLDSDYEETAGDNEFIADARLDSMSNNDALGVGNGGGGGGLGDGGKRYQRRGGTTRSESTVNRGLEWLARHQSPNGAWDADGFSCKAGGCSCQQGSKGGAMHDVGVTGLALLTFLGAGETHRNGEYKENVAKGLRWLSKKQDAEGCFAERTSTKLGYNQAIATLAMIEAYDMTRSPLLRASAEKGLSFCLEMQNPYRAWRYGVAKGNNDVSVTGWMIMVLKAAKGAKLPYDSRAAAWALDYIKELTSEESGRTGYVRPGEPTVREADKKEEFPSSESEAMTAVGVCSRIFLGEDPKTSRDIKLGVENLLLKHLPVWDRARGSIDMYYWYYGTLALYQVGGSAWKKWNTAMNDAIIDRQRRDGDASGSWDPIGAWGEAGGRVYSTALMTMCLQVYYRYGRVFGTR